MRVRDFAARAGVPPHVVRYYMRIGLLRPRRTANRYASFAESDRRRLAFVRQAQRLSFTLDEIRGLLATYDAGKAPCPEVRVIGRRRRAEKAAELRALSQLYDRIGKALRRWQRIPDGSPHDPKICPLIVASRNLRGWACTGLAMFHLMTTKGISLMKRIAIATSIALLLLGLAANGLRNGTTKSRAV